MARGPDPRKDPPDLAEVPRLLREGTERFHAREFWHAHESWEEAWHALRAAGDARTAELLHGMILAAAALENAKRGKEDGFKRQMAEGLYLMRTHLDRAAVLGVERAAILVDGLSHLYADACRRHDWTAWNAGGWQAPRIELA